MMKTTPKLCLLALSVSALIACSVTKDKQSIERVASDANGTARYRAQLQAESITQDAKRAAQRVHKPFITGKAVPVSRELTLPVPLRKGVDTTLLFDQGVMTLPVLASRIQDATGIPVQVMPDALLPAEDFLPNLNKENNQARQGSQVPYPTTADINADVNLDARVSPLPPSGFQAAVPSAPQPKSAGKRAVGVSASDLRANGVRPLYSTLDSIGAQLLVSWKYNEEQGAIQFYRTETRIFEVRGLEVSSSTELSAGMDGSTDGSRSSNGLDSRSKSTLKVEHQEPPMAALLKRVQQFMTRAGTVAAGEDGFVIVTDTKPALDKIGVYLREESNMRSRRVDLTFEQIVVDMSDASQAGLNLNLSLSNAAGNALEVSGLNSLIEQEGAALTLGLSAGSGRWAGSSVAAQALSKVGKIVTQKTETFGSTNGKAATIGRPQRLSYVNKMDQTPNSSLTTGPTLSMSTQELIYGRMITFLPYAYANGDISLNVKFDDTAEPPIEKISQPNGSFVQNPKVTTEFFVRDLWLRPGQPQVVAAVTADSQTSDERRTDRNASIAFGGSDVTQRTHRVVVSVVTAMVRER